MRASRDSSFLSSLCLFGDDRGFPLYSFGPRLESRRGDGHGDDRGTKKKGVHKGENVPLIPREVFLPRFFAFNLLSLFFSFLGVIRGGIFPLIVGRRFFSPSSFLLFIFFALIFMFFQGGNRGSFSPPIVRIPDRYIQE